MAALRELLATFAVHVDTAPLTKLDRQIDVLEQRIKSFAQSTLLIGTAAAYGTMKLVNAASDTVETMNVLEVVFKKNTDSVVKWSEDTGAAMGRSAYDLQKYASQFGSFLAPNIKDADKLKDMTQELTKLAVDLGSFYNTSDAEAVMRLFSGMSGETEAVRRLGIDISDTALDQFSKENQDVAGGRSMRAMDLPEKAALRFRKIMHDTVQAQGDAARTIKTWANQVKLLEANVKTLAVQVGRALMPPLLKVLQALNKMDLSMKGLQEAFVKIKPYVEMFFQGLLIYTGAVLAQYVLMNAAVWTQVAAAEALALMWGQTLGGVLKATTPLVGAMLALGFYAFAFNDVLGLFAGKKTVIGELTKELTGTRDVLQTIHDLMFDIMSYFSEMFDAPVLPDEFYGKPLTQAQADDLNERRASNLTGGDSRETPYRAGETLDRPDNNESRKKDVRESRDINQSAAVKRGGLEGAKAYIAARDTTTATEEEALREFERRRLAYNKENPLQATQAGDADLSERMGLFKDEKKPDAAVPQNVVQENLLTRRTAAYALRQIQSGAAKAGDPNMLLGGDVAKLQLLADMSGQSSLPVGLESATLGKQINPGVAGPAAPNYLFPANNTSVGGGSTAITLNMSVSSPNADPKAVADEVARQTTKQLQSLLNESYQSGGEARQ